MEAPLVHSLAPNALLRLCSGLLAAAESTINLEPEPTINLEPILTVGLSREQHSLPDTQIYL